MGHVGLMKEPFILVVDTNGNYYIAGPYGYGGTEYGAIYKSTDGGMSWVAHLGAVPCSGIVISVCYDAPHHRILFYHDPALVDHHMVDYKLSDHPSAPDTWGTSIHVGSDVFDDPRKWAALSGGLTAAVYESGDPSEAYVRTFNFDTNTLGTPVKVDSNTPVYYQWITGVTPGVSNDYLWITVLTDDFSKLHCWRWTPPSTLQSVDVPFPVDGGTSPVIQLHESHGGGDRIHWVFKDDFDDASHPWLNTAHVDWATLSASSITGIQLNFPCRYPVGCIDPANDKLHVFVMNQTNWNWYRVTYDVLLDTWYDPVRTTYQQLSSSAFNLAFATFYDTKWKLLYSLHDLDTDLYYLGEPGPPVWCSPEAASVGLGSTSPVIFWINKVGYPCRDISINGWKDEDGHTDNLYPSLHDPAGIDNLTYVKSPTNPAHEIYRTKLCSMTAPTEADSNTRLTFTYRSNFTGNVLNFKLRIQQGTTTIIEKTYLGVASASVVTIEYDWTTLEKAAVSDWEDLYAELEAYV